MSRVAEACEHAWLRNARFRAEEVVIAGRERNRPIAFPYTKLQVANSSVNQGAGFIVTSLAEALRRGMAEESLVFMSATARRRMRARDFLQRDSYTASPSLDRLYRTLPRNEWRRHATDLDHVELYSLLPLCAQDGAARAWLAARQADHRLSAA